jgi:hypothetical protein
MPPRSRSSPPPPPPSSRPPRKKHKGERRVSLDAKAIDAALVPIVSDPRDRAFVLRCILEEGPRHHRVASFALLRMLARVLEDVGGAAPGSGDGASAPLAMRLPPGVASRSDDAEFPIGVPTALLGELFDEAGAAEALECLRDGPPHHALANAAMAWMIQAIHERVRGSRG